MTTAQSPIRELEVQANAIAARLKAAERGGRFAANHPESRVNEIVKFAVVMDDKILKIEMTWATIRDTSEAGIAEYILRQMREARDTAQ